MLTRGKKAEKSEEKEECKMASDPVYLYDRECSWQKFNDSI
jgi:hypothetical protein